MVLNSPPDGVLIAAGKSERMGHWKMMLPLGRSTVIEVSLRTMLAACRRVILVAGYRGEELAVRFAGRADIQVVMNRNFEEGMFSSVLRGCKEVETEYFFFGLGDMPMVCEETYRALIRAAEENAGGFHVFIPVYAGKEGHPVLLSGTVAQKIEAAEGGSGTNLREVLEGFPLKRVPVSDAGILQDLDTLADYEQARQRRGKNIGL